MKALIHRFALWLAEKTGPMPLEALRRELADVPPLTTEVVRGLEIAALNSGEE